MDWAKVAEAERFFLEKPYRVNSLLRDLDGRRAAVFRNGVAAYDSTGFPVEGARRASKSLHDGVTGSGMPDYDDPLVGLSYILCYQVQHILMAACFWYGFLVEEFPEGCPRLEIYDFAAGADAGLHGLALALDYLPDQGAGVLVDRYCSFEPGRGMQWAADLWDEVDSVDYLNFVRIPSAAVGSERRRDGVVRVMTAFHPHLEYQGVVPARVRSDFRAALYSFGPDYLLLSAHKSKAASLDNLAESFDAEEFEWHEPDVELMTAEPSALGDWPYQFGFEFGLDNINRFNFYERVRFGFPKDTYLRIESNLFGR